MRTVLRWHALSPGLYSTCRHPRPRQDGGAPPHKRQRQVAQEEAAQGDQEDAQEDEVRHCLGQ